MAFSELSFHQHQPHLPGLEYVDAIPYQPDSEVSSTGSAVPQKAGWIVVGNEFVILHDARLGDV